MAFPVLEMLVGPAFFEMAVARFQRQHPPASACLDDYGAIFPEYLGEMREAALFPYLTDVGRFEWALSVAAHAQDVPALGLDTFRDIGPETYALLRFRIHPSVTIMQFGFPVDRIAGAVLADDDDAMASIDLGESPIWLLVHRGASGVAAERLAPAAYKFLRRLFAGDELGAIFDQENPDIAQTLARQFMLGTLTGFSVAVAHASPEIVL